MKIRWVIYNQFKVLLLFDGFVASIIKLEYDVFTIIQGFQYFEPFWYFLIFQFYNLFVLLSFIIEVFLWKYFLIQFQQNEFRIWLTHEIFVRYDFVSRIPVYARNHTHSCFFMILTFMSLNLNLTQTRQTNWMESIRNSIIISL